MLRVKELATAEMLTEQLPRVEVFTLMSVSGVDDSSEPGSGIDFKSRNEDRISVSEVPMLTPAELITLPKGQAFALLEGGQLWKIRMPLPAAESDMPETLTEIANEMERTYITNDHWYRVQEPWWAGRGGVQRTDDQYAGLQMAEALADPRRRVVEGGLISKSLTAIAKIIQWLLLSLVFSIIIEWAGMVLWWPEEGIEHSRTMLAREISYLDTDFRRSVVTSDPGTVR